MIPTINKTNRVTKNTATSNDQIITKTIVDAQFKSGIIPAGNYLLKVNNRSTRARCEICSKLTIKTPERRLVFIVNFEYISHLALVFLLLTLNM